MNWRYVFWNFLISTTWSLERLSCACISGCVSDMGNAETHEFVLLAKYGVDLQMRIPQRRLEFMGRGILEV